MTKAKKVAAKKTRAKRGEKKVVLTPRDKFIAAYDILTAVSAAWLGSSGTKSERRLKFLYDDVAGQFQDASIEYAAHLSMGRALKTVTV